MRNANGEGTFRKLSDGRFVLRLSVGYKPDGHRRIFTVTAESREAAKKLMNKKIRELKMSNGESDTKTVSELCRCHLASQVKGRELKPKSIDRRETTIKCHIEQYDLGHMLVSEVRGSDIENHINKLIDSSKLSPSSIVKVVDVLYAAYNWAFNRGELNENPVSSVRKMLKRRIGKLMVRSESDADVKFLSKEEQELLIQETMKMEKNGKRHYRRGIEVRCLLYSGMRCGELIALRWNDINLSDGYITINKSRGVTKQRKGKTGRSIQFEDTTKNGKSRIIKMNEPACIAFLELKNQSKFTDDDDFVVSSNEGKPITATTLEHSVNLIYKGASLEDVSGLHILRRTFATNCAQKGATNKQIAEYIGNLPSTTEKYYIGVRQAKILDGKKAHVVEPPG